ncbi:hypothetical protein Taro_031102 [Colocasia esculenta]|uniref:Uncharacterized protein n=1 Tax=Colocasia esculenta TaxID=4460 RepID=A0A843VTS1_COLES|nr:hypothetical protein [Colocasia esculenta]
MMDHIIAFTPIGTTKEKCDGLPRHFPTEPVTSEAHPYSPQARARRRFLYRRPVRSRDVACMVSPARLRPVRGRRTRVKHVTGLTGLDEAFRHSWYQSKAAVMADRRDWGGGGDDPEESTQRMIERIWESLTEIRMRMDQQTPVPPVTGEAVLVAPVPPLPGVESPYQLEEPAECKKRRTAGKSTLWVSSSHGTCAEPAT